MASVIAMHVGASPSHIWETYSVNELYIQFVNIENKGWTDFVNSNEWQKGKRPCDIKVEVVSIGDDIKDLCQKLGIEQDSNILWDTNKLLQLIRE